MTAEPIRYAAFMRAINVGKRRVKMDALRTHIGQLGFGDVETVIASGNVVFTDPLGRSADEVGRLFDAGLSAALGFEVVSGIRSNAEVDAVIEAQPFGSPDDAMSDWTSEDVVHVSFLLADAPAEAADRLGALETAEDRFALIGRDLYWRRRGKLTASPVEPKILARALGVDATARRLDTVTKIARLLHVE